MNNYKTITRNIVVSGLYIWLYRCNVFDVYIFILKIILMIFIGIVLVIFSFFHLFSFKISIVQRHKLHCLNIRYWSQQDFLLNVYIYQYARTNSDKGERQETKNCSFVCFVKFCEGDRVSLPFASFICLWPQQFCT